MKFKNIEEKLIWENAVSSFLLEGQNEDLTKKILASTNKENDLDNILSIDPTTKNKYSPVIAQYYINGTDLNSLKHTFDKMPDIENKIKISPIRTKKGIFWNKQNDTFNIKSGVSMNFTAFSKQVNDLISTLEKKANTKASSKGKPTSVKTSDGEDPNLIFNKNGIKVYEAYSQGACVTYSKGQSFCIGNAAGGMYNIYRGDKSSSFHFVFDQNMPYPLQVVVIDQTNNGIELTDEKNTTDTIQNPNNLEDENDRGNYRNEYVSYLKSKGVDMSVFKNNPYTEEESDLNKLVSQSYSLTRFKEKILGKTQEMKNGDIVDLTLEWLIRNGRYLPYDFWEAIITNPITKQNKNNYAWRMATSGHIIEDEVLNTFSQGNFDKYIITQAESGNTATEEQLAKMSPEVQQKYWKSYVLSRGKKGWDIKPDVFAKVSPEIQQQYWNSFVISQGDISERIDIENLSKVSPEIQQKYWDKFILNSIKHGQDVNEKDLSKVSPEIQQKYWDLHFLNLVENRANVSLDILEKTSPKTIESLVINMGEKSSKVQKEILEKVSPDIKQQYWDLFLKNSGYISFDQYIFNKGSLSQIVDSEILSKASPEGQQKYWAEYFFTVDKKEPLSKEILEKLPANTIDIYILNNIDRNYTVEPWVLEKSSPEVQEKYWYNFIQNKGFDSFEDFVLNSGIYAQDVKPVILSKVSPEVQQKFYNDYISEKSKRNFFKDSDLKYLQKTDPEVHELYWDKMIKSNGFDSFQALIDGLGKDVAKQYLAYAPPEFQKKYWSIILESKKKNNFPQSRIQAIIKEEIQRFFKHL